MLIDNYLLPFGDNSSPSVSYIIANYTDRKNRKTVIREYSPKPEEIISGFMKKNLGDILAEIQVTEEILRKGLQGQ